MIKGENMWFIHFPPGTSVIRLVCDPNIEGNFRILSDTYPTYVSIMERKTVDVTVIDVTGDVE